MVSYNPTNLQEALELRAAKKVIPYAGGTDLMVGNRDAADYLFLNRLRELKEIREDEDMIRIGAAVRAGREGEATFRARRTSDGR